MAALRSLTEGAPSCCMAAARLGAKNGQYTLDSGLTEGARSPPTGPPDTHRLCTAIGDTNVLPRHGRLRRTPSCYRPSVTSAHLMIVLLLRNWITPGSITAG